MSLDDIIDDNGLLINWLEKNYKTFNSGKLEQLLIQAEIKTFNYEKNENPEDLDNNYVLTSLKSYFEYLDDLKLNLTYEWINNSEKDFLNDLLKKAHEEYESEEYYKYNVSYFEYYLSSINQFHQELLIKSNENISDKHTESKLILTFEYLEYMKELNENSEIVKEQIINIIKKDKYFRFQIYNQIIEFKEIKYLPELIECASIDTEIYNVACKLGKGAVGKAYKVYSDGLSKPKALKIIDPERVNYEEANFLEKLNHPNIVKVHEASNSLVKVDDEKKFAIIMEYVDGKELGQIIKENISLEDTLNYSKQLFEGISYLKENGITHRDLNTHNIKINEDGILKIIDFGIATDKENPDIRGNRRYGSPQQADDLFSLGLLTYEMVTGEHLIYSKDEEIDTYTYAEIVKELKKEVLDSEGKLSKDYFDKVWNYFEENKTEDKKFLYESLRNIVVLCLNSNTDIQTLNNLYGLSELKNQNIKFLQGEYYEHGGIKTPIENKDRVEEIINGNISMAQYLQLRELFKDE